MVSLAYVMNLSGMLVDGEHHEIRHGRHYRRQAGARRYYEYEFENTTIVQQPEFLNSKTNVSAREGELATLPCGVRNLGTKQVAWKRLGAKDGHFMTVGTFTWVRENNIQVDHRAADGKISYWNLIIKSVHKDDEGTYECQITDKVPLRKHIHLIVLPRPAVKPAVVLMGNEFVDRNEPIKLRCNATGPKIPEDIDWFKDGTKLDTRATKNPNIIITKYMSLEDQAFISDLVIEHTDTGNSGTYICRSSDREVGSLKVTVLVADTTNVKRGTGAQQSERQSNKSSGTYVTTVSLVPVTGLLLTLSALLS
ncbi:hypothetical protein BsWGS_05054 [Bradybaena similaris]